jgi:hypothetical protein
MVVNDGVLRFDELVVDFLVFFVDDAYTCQLIPNVSLDHFTVDRQDLIELRFVLYQRPVFVLGGEECFNLKSIFQRIVICD